MERILFQNIDFNFLEGSLAIAITVNKSHTKFMILSVEDQTFDLYINFWDVSICKKHSKKLNTISKRLKVAMSLEISEDDSTIFLAGCDNLDLDKATPVISAITFDKNMNEIACLDLKCQTMTNIFYMKRLENTNTMLLSGK